MLKPMSSKTITPSRSVKHAQATRATASPRRSSGSRAGSTSSRVKKLATTAIAVPLAKRALKNVKSKAGLAVLTGVALAVGAGLVRKYRKAAVPSS
jgi:hypothetical protein